MMNDVTITISLPAELVERATKLGMNLEAVSFATVWVEAVQERVKFAEAATDKRTAHLATVSPFRSLVHELWAPVVCIQGYSDLLRARQEEKISQGGELSFEEHLLTRMIEGLEKNAAFIGNILQRYSDAMGIGTLHW